MGAEEAEKQMTKRLEVARAPAPLEEYVKHFDPLFGKSNQRDGFRRYIEGLLLPSERHKTLTGLVSVTSLWADEEIYYPVDARTLHPCSPRVRRARTIPPFGQNSRSRWNW